MNISSRDLLSLESMPEWSDISLSLYKDFSEKYLIPNTFRYYLENDQILDVCFTEWSVYHILGIQHINGKVSKANFFDEIEKGLDFDSFMKEKNLRKRLFDNKNRIRMFACIYMMLKNKNLFYVNDRKLRNSSVVADYIKFELIDGKGINLGIRCFNGEYIAYTMLVNRGSNPTRTVENLMPVRIEKLEIIRDEVVIETVVH